MLLNRRKVLPIITWSPWNPVAMKKVDRAPIHVNRITILTMFQNKIRWQFPWAQEVGIPSERTVNLDKWELRDFITTNFQKLGVIKTEKL